MIKQKGWADLDSVAGIEKGLMKNRTPLAERITPSRRTEKCLL